MAAEMTRLPTFYDLKIGALAENGIREDTKKRKRIRFYSILVEVTAATLKRRKPVATLRKKSRVSQTGGPKTRDFTFGLVSFPPFYFVSP